MTEGSRYQVRLDAVHWVTLESWDERRLDEVLVFLRDHASRTPTQRIPRKLKQLRGRYRGFFQYSVDTDHKLIDRVDEDAKQVLVEYVVSHPDWRKSRGGRIRS